MKKPSTGAIVFCAVSGAFLLLIAAWCVLFWLASNNRVEDVPLAEPVAPRQHAKGAAEAP